jgi:hypothetical protein
VSLHELAAMHANQYKALHISGSHDAINLILIAPFVHDKSARGNTSRHLSLSLVILAKSDGGRYCRNIIYVE